MKAMDFTELSSTEMYEVNGGDSERGKIVAKTRESGGVHVTEEEEKAAISYTLGYLSLATCWCAPVSFAFGLIGTLYSCI